MTTYFQQSMTFHPPTTNAVAQSHNATISYDPSAFLPFGNMSNPLQVSYPSYIQPLTASAPAVFDSIGLGPQARFSSGILHGYGYWTSTIDPRTETRSSAQSAFLDAALDTSSLTVYINTLAQNIVFNSNGTAIGVNVTSNSDPQNARYYMLSARKEVILSAGAWHSPQILMLSGIGPAVTSRNFSIPVVSVLEGVGQNMWDSTNLGGVTYRLNNSITTFSTIQNSASLMTAAQQQFIDSGTGPLTSIGSDFVAWYKIPKSTASTFSNAIQAYLGSLPSNWPEFEIFLSSSSFSLGFTNDLTKVSSMSIVMTGAASRGNMTIQSNSIFDRPIISPNLLQDLRDQEVAIAAYRLVRQAWTGVPSDVVQGDEIFPGKNVTSDEDLLNAIKGNIAAVHHASASCAMGRAGDPKTLVNSRGRVRGVQRLRVVDSSSFPFTPAGHTQGTTYAHAEKMAAEFLRDM